ncbi:MAG: hypothetical protein BRD46_06045 [Bacteroidetes bacterium QS_8_68_15]|nr:MAG: hypothetical protein BRD46_06045 [Bacteroidetes bacterium QS_8_68_15]
MRPRRPTSGSTLCVRYRPSVLALAAGFALWLASAAPTVRPAAAQAQEALSDTTRRDTVPADSRRPGRARPDSLARGRAGPGRTGAGRGEGGAGQAPGEAVQFSASDSLVVVFGTENDTGDVGILYGNAEVKQQKATLSAYEVQMLFDRNQLRAVGPPSGVRADSGTVPRFQRGGGKAFTGRELSFDMETRRGRIVKARTRARQAFIQGDAVRVAEDSTLYIRGGRYTTCDCPRGETPSYSLRANKMKVQGQWAYTGPIQLFIFNIPMPLVLPFAFLPATPGRHGGIIPPSYGSNNRRGFYLRDFGYYWPINDYMDLQLTGSLWSRGSWGISPTFRYNRRYYYDGDLRVDYIRNIAGDVVDRDYLNRTTANIVWSHNQQFTPSQAPNASSLTADVDLASETYRRQISDDYRDNVTQKTSSSINFRKQWNNGNQRISLQLSQTQNLRTGEADLTMPSFSFNQNRIKPFARERRGVGGEERWYEKITTSYDGSLNNNFSFTPLDDSTLVNRGDSSAIGTSWYDALLSQSAYERATGTNEQRFDFSAEHRIPVSASFHVPRYDFNFTPNFTYREEWYPRTKRKAVRRRTHASPPDSDADSTRFFLDSQTRREVVTLTEPGFFAAREFDLGVSSSTRFYGFFPFRAGPLKNLRHTVEPSLSFNYAPDAYAGIFGRTRSYIDPDTDERVRYDITDGNDIRGSTAQQSLSFRLDNTFETKQISVDSTGATNEETLRLLTLDADARYNFAADSLGLSDVDMSLRFPVLQKKFDVSARASMTFSPYVYDENGRKLNRLVADEPGLFPARLSQFRASISTDFSGGDAETTGGRRRRRGGRRRQRGGRDQGRTSFAGARAGIDPSTGGTAQAPDRTPGNVAGRSSLRQGVRPYANFAIPWELSLDLSYAFRNEGEFEQGNFILNSDFSFNVTPKWRVSGVGGYDFNAGELVPPRLDITRDFQCWQMSFTWTPIGPRQSYRFNLHVKSGVLRDLLNLRLPNSDVKGRFTGALRGVARQATQQR